MLNNVILVGRLFDNPTTDTDTITLAVSRPYKNMEGVYETDYIDVRLPQNIQTQTQIYTKKGDMIGIKGRLNTEISNNGIKTTYILAERVTFLSSRTQTQTQTTEQNIMNKGEI